jgi:hypothetical protein
MNLSKRTSAEFLRTFWLLFGGCGSAVLAAAFPQLGIGFYGVAFAFGLTGPDHGLRHRAHFRDAILIQRFLLDSQLEGGSPPGICSPTSSLRQSEGSPARASCT